MGEEWCLWAVPGTIKIPKMGILIHNIYCFSNASTRLIIFKSPQLISHSRHIFTPSGCRTSEVLLTFIWGTNWGFASIYLREILQHSLKEHQPFIDLGHFGIFHQELVSFSFSASFTFRLHELHIRILSMTWKCLLPSRFARSFPAVVPALSH